MKIAVIGAGASGIIASIVAKRTNPDIEVDLYDKNDKIGKKLLITGNGRCNISNENITKNDYFGTDKNFVDFALKQFTKYDLIRLFESFGVVLTTQEDGKIFPLSNEAKTVVRSLENTLISSGVNINLNISIEEITKNSDKFVLTLYSRNSCEYDRVIIATGLNAYDQLGATDDAIKFAKSFDHQIIKTFESLVGLKTDFTYKKELFGVKKEALISLYIDGVKRSEIFGDLLFTNYGLSGLAILDISYQASLALADHKKVEIEANLFGYKSEMSNKIERVFAHNPDQLSLDLLANFVGYKLSLIAHKVQKINLEKTAKELTKKDIKSLVFQLSRFRFVITETNGTKHAEVMAGGVATKDIDPKTYESKLVKNLYFVGEALDIVGKRGGYNLHFAWASGALAGKAIAS